MPSDPPIRLRPLHANDAPAVRALVTGEINRSPYGRGPLAALEGALDGSDSEYRALVALDELRIVGVVVFGATAGAEGAGRLHLVAIDHAARMRGIAKTLVEAAARALGADGMRFVTVEIPDDPALAVSMSLLARCGFDREATIPDYFRDGVGLTILRRRLEAR